MTTLFYDCFAGISGDMNLGALLDLGVDQASLQEGLDRLDVEGLELRVSPQSRCGIAGTRVEVVCSEGREQPRRTLATVSAMIERSDLGDPVKGLALKVFQRLAVAEAKVHRIPLERVHFHEVGALDALVDIVGAAICLDALGWPRVIGSAVELGSGFIDCAHGRLPVPAPATLELLRGVPVRRGGLPFEATTPTGAAILTSIAERFDDQLSLVPRRVGYGVGTGDGPVPNLLRLALAGTLSTEPQELIKLECNIDDMSPEFYPHLIDRLLASGARDAWLTPLVMKKGRPGILVSVLCDTWDEEPMTRLLLTETTTLGLRCKGLSRTAVERTQHQLETRFGTVPVKVAELPGGGRRAKPEYEACRSIALEQGLPLQEVYREVERGLEE